jgi:hypothetical protein
MQKPPILTSALLMLGLVLSMTASQNVVTPVFLNRESRESTSLDDEETTNLNKNPGSDATYVGMNYSEIESTIYVSLRFSRVLLQSPSHPNGNVLAEDSEGAMITDSVGGDVYRMGANVFGQLGNGEASNIDLTFPPTYIRILRNKYPYYVGAGNDHSVVISEVSSFGFGRNTKNQLGFDDGKKEAILWPTRITGLQEVKVTNLAVSGDSNIAVLSDGSLIGWGDNSGGQLGGIQGQADNNEILKPSLLGNVGSLMLQQLAMGRRHTLALSSKGTVYVWGSNLFGQLGVDVFKEGKHQRGQTQARQVRHSAAESSV